MSDVRQFRLRQDRTGALWDLLLYVPTVVALAFWATATWFNGDRTLAYLLAFLASFFFPGGRQPHPQDPAHAVAGGAGGNCLGCRLGIGAAA